ncbi:MAG: F0F1 ATP synthase subunit A [Bryobacterales bacterium]|nr:F0F1 ATP synthase subunit A [Bryobacterales bacterium]MBV9398840.1 F0F1 ATP synthase subunit A [Bryobacterales bacterium]
MNNWLTALFNQYLGGFANTVLGWFNFRAEDPAHPWETWLVMELVVAAILMIVVAFLRPSLSADKPGRLQHIFESLYGFLRGQAVDVGLEHPDKYINWLGTIFITILTMNLLGIIPLFQSPTMYVYVPAAFAVMTWLYYHSMGIRELGVLKYLAKFGGPILALAPLMFVIEIIGDVARMLSLSVRLYGNMFAGEQITTVFIGLTYLIVPALFMALHVFVSFLQAYVFTLLTMIYLSLGTSHEH